MRYDPDAAPTVERTTHTVRTWGDLLPGDVINGGLGGVRRDEPLQALTVADVVDHYDWKPLIDGPRQVDLWVTFPDRKRERRAQHPFPIHQRMNWRVLVAVGPEPHFSVCLNAALRIDPENVAAQRAEIERVWS